MQTRLIVGGNAAEYLDYLQNEVISRLPVGAEWAYTRPTGELVAGDVRYVRILRPEELRAWRGAELVEFIGTVFKRADYRELQMLAEMAMK